MSTHVHLVCETPIKLWRLTSRDRLRRAFKRLGGTRLADDVGDIPAEDSILIIRGDYLFDTRVLGELLVAENTALRAADGESVVAAHVGYDDASAFSRRFKSYFGQNPKDFARRA